MSLNKLLSDTNVKVFSYIGDKIIINNDKSYRVIDKKVEEII